MKWNLKEIACKAMQERDLLYEFPKQVLHQANQLQERRVDLVYKDMRDAFWISIDNDDSLDLDQLTYADDKYIYVAIADVDGLVAKDSPIDRHAFYNTTSVYTDVLTFPVLPPRLSTNLSSLNQDADRPAVVVKMQIDNDGTFSLSELCIAWVRNHAKLTYNKVADSLNGKKRYDDTQILAQLALQDRMASKIKAFREKQGALQFETAMQVRAMIQNNKIVSLEPVLTNPAHALIENFMIAANVCISRYMRTNKLALLQRVVRSPKDWGKIMAYAKKFGYLLPNEPDNKALQMFLQVQKQKSPETFQDVSLSIIKLIGKGEYVAILPDEPSVGHFDLAQSDYAHTTAPNRRFPDLIMQRLLKAHLKAHLALCSLPYTNQELSSIAAHCTQKEDDAAKVERRVRKSMIAVMLSSQIGKKYSAIVTGASVKGTWVRITEPSVEGKLIKGYQGCDVGDSIQVRLLHTDVPNGFIDFERAD